MESTTEQSLTQGKPTETPVLYTASGWVSGTYEPSPDKFYQGVLVTQDGQGFGAELHWRLRNKLKRKHPGYAEQSDFFLEPARWMVYPSTAPLRFRLVIMKPLHSEDSGSQESGAEPRQKRELNHFRIVGEIETVVDGTITICIRRNEQPRKGQEDDPEYQPFVLTLEGSLPKKAIGQIWEVEGRRDGQMLVVVAGRPYQPSAEDLAWIEELQKQHSTAKKATGLADNAAAAKATPLPSPIIKPKPPGQTQATEQAEQPIVDATNAPPNSPAVPSIPEAKEEAPDYPPASPNADTSPTAGKMEVVVKLNQFPDDVRTVDKGWKEFEVDTGDCLVTITVKPKAFAALEQAQQTYPSWVAAISGQMGSLTATGFKLDSPAIKVFGRKAKDSSQSEETTVKDNSSPSSTTSSQPLSPAQTQTQQHSSLPKPESLPQPSPAANPMQRPKEHLKQQQPTKTPKNFGHGVDLEGGQASTNQPHLRQNQQLKQASATQKQAAASTPKSESQSEKPAFKVKVNDQIFTGRDSVTLIQRVVRVDGKPVGQAKMVIVLGQPRTMQADGGVSQGRNQAVLTSR